MEDITLEHELRLCDVKEENVGKTMEKLKSTASDVLIFNVQWSDLEDHLKSLREKVEKRYREVVSKEVELRKRIFALEERVKVVEAAEAEMLDLEMKSNVFRSEAEERAEELCVLRKLLEECSDEHRSKTSQLNELLELLRKTGVDYDLKGEQLRQMETDLERYHVKVNTEKEHLGMIENDRRELEADIEQKRKDLTFIVDKITECEQLFEKKSSEVRTITIDLQRQREEISSELDKSQIRSRELEQEIEENTKDRRKILDQIAESGKQLELAENQLDSQQKLIEKRSAELRKIQTEIELKGKQLEQMDFVLERQRGESSAEFEHLDRSQSRNRELDAEIERKKEDFTSRIAEYEKQLKSLEERVASQQELFEKQSIELVSKKEETCQILKSKNKELKEIEGLIQERTGRNESIELLLKEHSEELASKEKRQNEITEAIHKLSLNIVSKEKTIQRLSQKQRSKQKKLDLIDAEFVLKEKELCSVEDTYRECLQRYHVDYDLKGKQLSQMQTDLERYHVEVNAEKESLGRIENDRRELEADIERKRKDFTLVVDKITGCEQLYEKKSSEVRQITIDLQRQRDEISSEREHLDKSQTRSRELEQEIEEKTKDLTKILNQIAESRKQLELAENQLDSQQNLVETRSSELIKIQTEVESKGKQLEQMDLVLERHRGELSAVLDHLDRSRTRNRELEEETKRKMKDLETILDQIADRGKQLVLSENQVASQQKQLEILSLELVSKKKEFDGLNLDLDLANSLNDELKETSQQIKSKEKELEDIERLIQERTGQNESIKLLLEEHSEKLASKEKRQNEITEGIHKLSLEIVSKEKTIQQLSEKQHSKQKKLDLIDAEFVLKEKERCSVKDAYRECLQNWEIKRNELKSLEEEVKKIKESLKDFQAKEAEQVKSKASLMEREKELGLKEKQFLARSENIELKEKKLDAREERLNKKDEQLKSAEQKVAKCVKDYELKAKKLASFCQQNKPDQQVDLVRDASVLDEKTLQLLLYGHLKKCHTPHLDVLSALKASSDPAKLVLVTIQELHERMVVAKLEPDSVNRSSICLLECLMNISPEPKNGLLEEAIKSAAEWKSKTLVKAENPMEALGFLHFLAAFSLAYTFDADKVHSLFDAAFLRQYVPSLFNNVLSSLGGNPEQQLPVALITNSCDFQENIALSHLGNEDALLEPDGLASFSPNEIRFGLQGMNDPAGYVLNLVKDELMSAQRRGELSLTEPIVKHLVSLLEELPHVVRSSKHLLSDALQVADRWSRMLDKSSQMSPLEVWGFLQLIVAYELVYRTNGDSNLRFASKVAHFKQAPKLFESLGLTYAILELVEQLLDRHHYLLAIRFILYFNLNYNFPSLKVLKEEIVTLRLSAKDKRRFNTQAEDRDAAKLKDIVELIDEFKLEIDLPVDLIVKFMVPREIQNQNPYVVSSYGPVQLSFPTILGTSPTQQILQLETYQAGGSTVVHGQSSHQAGFKRPRVDPSVSRSAIRPCFNQSSYDRFSS